MEQQKRQLFSDKLGTLNPEPGTTSNQQHINHPPSPGRLWRTSQPSTIKGFTLVELMAVIGIISLLAGLILGVAGYATRRMDMTRARAELEKLRNALEDYRINKGSIPVPPGHPAHTQFTNTTFYKDFTNGLSANYDTTEISKTDPWANGYYYQKIGTFQYKIWSLGIDAKDAADDISNQSGSQ